MLVQPSQPLEGRLDVFCGNKPDLLGPQDADEPPVTVAIIHKDQNVPFGNISLALYRRSEAVQSIHKVTVKVERFIRNRELG